MRQRHTLALAAVSIGLVSTTVLAEPVLAKSISRRDFIAMGFQMQGKPLGGTRPAKATAPYLAGSRITALGEGALVIDADTGQLIKTDKDGKLAAAITVGKHAGLLAYDPDAKRAYVADRAGNRVAVVSVAEKLTVTASYATPVEPYGIALSPDRKTLLVTTIADRALVALDAASGKEQWRAALGREPRSVAVSPDGSRALVAYLATGTVDQVELRESRKAEHVALSTMAASRGFRDPGQGDSFARGSFTALFLGEQQAVIPFQRETPVQAIGAGERTGSYGGGFEAPITQQLAFLASNGERTSQVTASIGLNQVRALAWDSKTDQLFVAGLGGDMVQRLKNASQLSIADAGVLPLNSGAERCGPDGLAVTDSGDVLVWCSFSRSVKRLSGAVEKNQWSVADSGPSLVPSSLTDKQHEGLVLFHTASAQVSSGGAMACASCHPDGRADGLSWRIDKQELQTPVLVGRVVGTHPYKWDGGDATLKDSLTNTMKRLGGSGLSKTQTESLAAYLEYLPKPPAPTRDAQMVARGEKLFDSAELGCRTCHDGPTYSDNEKHKFSAATLPEADTPSLIGLAAGAPYYHDGSAATLESLLRDRGRVHGMAETAKLDDKQLSDLIAYLETL